MSIISPSSVAEEPVVSDRGTPTWEIAYLFPLQGEWTEEAYLALETNRFVELSDGCLEVLPMPTFLHQFIIEYLFDAMRAHLKQHGIPGRVVPGPLPVHLWKGKYREPDLGYFRPENIHVHGYADGADLAVEIVSSGSKYRKHDFQTKRGEYAKAGIPEYWIIDPEQPRITVLTLDGGGYRLHGEFQSGQQATSVLWPGFQVDVSAVFAAGMGEEIRE